MRIEQFYSEYPQELLSRKAMADVSYKEIMDSLWSAEVLKSRASTRKWEEY